ncbi:response regulator [Ferrimicrobium acidiphilum]|jgi:DNA-binding NarL/FixJ family response regulator|uniref:Transcriptional regulatory protein DevR (DosR) n=1 Tax=Ferrimicrobium acidiphilum DSM 19497 TaxID=1121877 RepID=A0A0D8FTX0_9ACTN|nr:response regulator transcription factor [Ferrimicrobium acidiphilum]KJE76710.1 transcriptional regulatory protein DevR (DosR) [Ferrimicrobium acidiphilum DSM 19497]
MIRLFIVEDHEVVRRGIVALLTIDPEFEVVGEAGGVEEALQRFPLIDADVAILDVRLGDGDGVSLCRDLRSQDRDLKCIMLTSFSDDEALFSAIMAGASGYLLKKIKVDELVDSIKRIAAGESLIDAGLTTRLLERLRDGADDPLSNLTEQERKIFDLIVEGRTNREIAAEVYLAEKTVKNYVSNLLAKLGVRHRSQVAAMGARLAERKRFDHER